MGVSIIMAKPVPLDLLPAGLQPSAVDEETKKQPPASNVVPMDMLPDALRQPAPVSNAVPMDMLPDALRPAAPVAAPAEPKIDTVVNPLQGTEPATKQTPMQPQEKGLLERIKDFGYEQFIEPKMALTEELKKSFQRSVPQAKEMWGEGLIQNKNAQMAETNKTALAIYDLIDQGKLTDSGDISNAYMQMVYGPKGMASREYAERGGKIKQLFADLDFMEYLHSSPEHRAKMRAGVETAKGQAQKRFDESVERSGQNLEEMQALPAKVSKFTDIRSPNDLGLWLAGHLPETLITNAPQLAAGYGLGAPGLALASIAPELGGGTRERVQYIQQLASSEPDPAKRRDMIIDYVNKTADATLSAAITNGALDMFGPEAEAVKLAAKNVLAKEVRSEILKKMPKAVLTETGTEGFTGALQEMVNMATERTLGELKGDIVTWDNVKRIINSAADEALGGFGMSTGMQGIRAATAPKEQTAAGKALSALDAFTEEEARKQNIHDSFNRLYSEEELRQHLAEYRAEQAAGTLSESNAQGLKNLEAWEEIQDRKNKEEAAQTEAESTGEKRDVSTYLEGLPQDTKRYNKYINHEEVGPLLQSANNAIQRLTDFINGRGFSVREVNRATADKEAQRAKDLASEVSGIASRLMVKQDGVDRNLKRANPEQLAQAKAELEAFINNEVENFLSPQETTGKTEDVLTDELADQESVEPEPEDVIVEDTEETPPESLLDDAKREHALRLKELDDAEAALDDAIVNGDTDGLNSAQEQLDAAKRAAEDAYDRSLKFSADEEERNAQNEADRTPPDEGTSYFGSSEIDNTVGKNVADAARNIVNDFMVGDEVRIGNMPGVVVGVEGDYLKVQPYGAKNAKAYQRVQKNLASLVARPDTSGTVAKSAAPEKEEFGEEEGRLNANMAGLIQLLGANMYASKLADVSVKELLQNSFDAVKGAISGKKSPSLYKTGMVNIVINRDERTITVVDNARGMSPDIVRNAFFTVAGSDKSDLDPQDRSGGLGLAKMGFMLGSERLQLVTVNNGIKTTVDATANEIANSEFKLVKTKADPSEHGTSITVTIPESYTDPKNGDQRPIWFPAGWESFEALTKPLIGPVEISVTTTAYGSTETTVLPLGVNFDESKYRKVSADFSWGTADIFFGINRVQYPKHQVLSSGVYQFLRKFNISEMEVIPYDIIINVKPNVDAKHPDYPFTNSRESFKERLEEDIKALSAYLAQIARGEEAKSLKENFKNIVSMPRVDVNAETAETAKKLKKVFDKGRAEGEATYELPPLPRSVSITDGQVFDSKGTVILEVGEATEKKKEGSFKASEAAPTSTDAMIEMQQDPSLPIFHNNTNVDYVSIGEAYGNPQQFFAELGTLMVEMKEALATSGLYKYDILSPQNLFFGGISVDKGYGGVHIKVPYKAVLLNPFYDWGARSLFGIRMNLLNTMIHEIAHTGDMGHGPGHNTQMIKVEQHLADSGMLDYFRDALLDILVRHESTFTAMREAYGQSTTANTAKSFEDYEGNSASTQDGRVRTVGDDQTGVVPSGKRPGGGGAVPASGANIGKGGFPRASRKTDTKGNLDKFGTRTGAMHSSVLDAIKNNDLQGALKLVAERLGRVVSGTYSDSKFSAELAKVLLDLNLPTSIAFDTARSMAERNIFELCGAQRIQLMSYLRSKLSEAEFNKYFSDYTNENNIENVYRGLRALENNPAIKPVLAQYNLTLDTYSRVMNAVVGLGAYFPGFDAISLNTDSVEGISYRTFLHEVVHAATEHMLGLYYQEITTGEKLLTDEQRSAIDELSKLYILARSKIATDEYGLTDISEFITETFTNKEFRDMLAKIPYAETKKSLMDKFVEAILRLVGINNVASATMNAAYKVFSNQRMGGAAIPKAARKRGSPYKLFGKNGKPGNWRSQEDQTITKRQLIKQAFDGKRPWGEVRGIITRSMWKAKAGATRRFLARAGSNRMLADVTQGRFPQLQSSIHIVDQMVAYRNAIINEGGEIAERWTALRWKNREQETLMCRIMLESTIRGTDPSTAQLAPTITMELLDAWHALNPEYKALYYEVRDFYAKGLNRFKTILKDNAKNITDPVKRQKVMDKLDRMFSATNIVSPYFPLRRLDGNFWFQVGKGQNKEFYKYSNEEERNLAMEDRRAALISSGKQVLAESINMGNTLAEVFAPNENNRNSIIEDIEKLIDDITGASPAQIKDQLHDSIQQLFYVLLPQQSMRKMFIHRQSTQGASQDMLRVFSSTVVRMAYQQARFKYASAYQNNITNAHEYINKYKDPYLQAAYRDYIYELQHRAGTVLGTEDKSGVAKVEGGLAELTFHMMLSAPASVLLNLIGFTVVTLPSIGAEFGYSATSKLAAKNLWRYMGTSPERTFKPAVKGNLMQMSFPSAFADKNLSPLLKRAAKRFTDDGDVNISMTYDIFDLSDKPSGLVTSKLDTARKAMAAPFHQMERLCREIAMLTTFELAFNKYRGSDKKDMYGVVQRDAAGQPIKVNAQEAFEMAVDSAKKIAGLTLGDVARAVRSPWFSTPGLQTLLRFKQYAFNMSYIVGRNLYLSLGAPLSGKEIAEFRRMLETELSNAVDRDKIIEQRLKEFEARRRETYNTARKMMLGIFGMAFTYGGLEAIPGGSLLIFMLALGAKSLGGDDEDFWTRMKNIDSKNWWRNYMETVIGGRIGSAFESAGMESDKARRWGRSVAEGIERGPIATMTGASLSERVGMDPLTMLYRDGRYSPDIHQSFVNTAIANAGPTVGMLFSWIDAGKFVMEGQYERAFEKAMPALVSKPLTANRLANEGATTPGGVPLVKDITAWEVALQAIGFQPERVAQAQQANMEVTEAKVRIENERASILDRLWMERNNPEGTRMAYEEVFEFNAKHPGYPIKGQQIMDSMREHQMNVLEAEIYGAKMPKGLFLELGPKSEYGRQ